MMQKMRESDSKEDLDEAFSLFDKNQDKVITFDDLKAVAIELSETMTDEELLEMLAGATQQKNDRGEFAVTEQAFKQMLSKSNNNG